MEFSLDFCKKGFLYRYPIILWHVVFHSSNHNDFLQDCNQGKDVEGLDFNALDRLADDDNEEGLEEDRQGAIAGAVGEVAQAAWILSVIITTTVLELVIVLVFAIVIIAMMLLELFESIHRVLWGCFQTYIGSLEGL